MAIETLKIDGKISNNITANLGVETDAVTPGCHIEVAGNQVKITIPKSNTEGHQYLFSKKEIKALMESLYMDN